MVRAPWDRKVIVTRNSLGSEKTQKLLEIFSEMKIEMIGSIHSNQAAILNYYYTNW